MGLLLPLVAVAALAIVALLLSHFNWRSYHKGQLGGPAWVWPLFGATLSMITDPYGFWVAQRKYGRLSWNSIFGHYLILAGDVASCRAVLNNVGYVCSVFFPIPSEFFLWPQPVTRTDRP